MVAAEVFRYTATQNEAAASTVWQYFDGMRDLNDVTGIKASEEGDIPGNWRVGWEAVAAPISPLFCSSSVIFPVTYHVLQSHFVAVSIQGLFGRSFVVPNETHGDDGLWVNSTAPGFEGWQWKADASSDELCGHLFAFTTVANFMNGSAGPDGVGSAQEAAQYLVDIADYITSNGFYLIGEQGLERLVVHGRLESTSVCSSAAPH